MDILRPQSAEELAGLLGSIAEARKRIRLGGAFSKEAMGGPLDDADSVLSTSNLNRVLQYEPRDLTISVEAGMRWRDVCKLLADHDQMVALDPPFFEEATVGGVVSANTSGPRRRLYGTARDVVIGMQFATLEGKLVQSGGMVVKNVAGLDMGKLMIGSFGTLAAITVVNFKLAPRPEQVKTFVLRSGSLPAAMENRDRVLQSVLQPLAVDLLNPAAAARAGLDGWSLVIEAGGNGAVLERYAREFAGAEVVEGEPGRQLWTRIREFTPLFLAEYPEGAVARISTTLSGTADALKKATGPAVARAGNGIVYCYFETAAKAELHGQKGAIEFAPVSQKGGMDLWPQPGTDFPIMQKLKRLFDPNGLLNRGRLYGRI